MDANNKISNLVNSQVPFFVRNDHQNFVRFIEAYYEWLEQSDTLANTKQYSVVTRSKNLLSYRDVDRTVDDFSGHIYDTFLKIIPENTIADKALILKNIKDFYRAKGTEKSIQFLMRILFGIQETDFYYPKKDVLRASDGKWFIEKSLKFNDVFLNGSLSTDILDAQKFSGLQITGNTSGATALVERVDRYYEEGTLVKEFKISNQNKDFFSGEQVNATFTENGQTNVLVANTFSGIINSVTLTNPGSLYNVGDEITIESNTGTGAIIKIDSVSTGNIRAIIVLNGGAGFKKNDNIVISGGAGTPGSANVSNVDISGSVHPNTYNIVFSQISFEANTNISNSIYSTLNNANANTTLANAFQTFVYSNTGPITQTLLINPGEGFTASPIFNTQANTRIRNLGILGKMDIVDGGQNYKIGDVIEFINVLGCYGVGARANVKNVNNQQSNAISEVQFVQVPGQIIGGSGYIDTLTLTPMYPSVNVVSATGNGANIVVSALLGFGEEYRAVSSTIGQIQKLTIVTGGSGYDTAPTLNLKSIGDGTAQAVATIVTGAYTYPGRWLNDDGHLSSYNFLQDRDYYQNFSYVVKVTESIEKYRQALKDLIHPSGMKLFGEYLFVDDNSPVSNLMGFRGTNTRQYIEYNDRSYRLANLNSNVTPGITISMNTSGLQVNSELYVSFSTGNVASYNANNIYYVSNVINSNAVLVYAGTKIPASMNVFNREPTPTGIYFKYDGRTMYLIGQTNDRVNMYNLQYPWDISSATFVTRSSAAVADAAPTGIHFSSNGKFMYVSGSTTKNILQYTLNESWNVNTATLLTSYNVNSQELTPQDVKISNNGSYMYVVGDSNDRIVMYTLGTAWNINTANYTANVNVSTQDAAPTGIHFRDDGKILYMVGITNDRIYQYTLSESWNILSATYTTNTASFASIEGTTLSVFLNNRGDVVYFIGNGNDILVQAPLRESWNIASIILDRFNTTGNTGNVTVMKNIY